LRQTACVFLAVLQVLILLTGNYCFFNLLTLALCVLLLDDAALRRLLATRWKIPWHRFGDVPSSNGLPTTATGPAPGQSRPAELQESAAVTDEGTPPNLITSSPQGLARPKWPIQFTIPLACIAIISSLIQFGGMLHLAIPWPSPVKGVYNWLGPFRTFNSYGLFAVMTTSRPEIIIEGSDDSVTWLEYQFKYKPGDLKQRPKFVEPHQPRLDWQMWFAALSDHRHAPWIVNFCARLLQGTPQVLALLKHNPFPNSPPRYIRAVVYEYHFTDLATRQQTGNWWRREWKGEYLPIMSLPKKE